MSQRVVALGATEYFKFTTRQSTGAPTTLAGTPVISVYEDANLTQITAGITLTVDYDSVTGLNHVAVVASTGNGYEAGKRYYLVITTGTVNSVSVVGEVVGEFRMETAEEQAARRLQGLFSSHTVGATGNSTTAMHASFLPASLGNDEVNGEVWAWYDASEDDWLLIRVTDYVASTQVATVELLNKSALPAAPASGDYCFRISHNAVDVQRVTGTNVTWSATRGLAGTALPNAAAAAAGGLPVSDAGVLDLDALDSDIDTLLTRIVGTLAAGTHNAQSGDAFAYLGTNLGAAGVNATEAGGTGDHLTAVGLTGVDEAALQQIVDDWENGGRLDLLLDAIKAVTDALTAAAAAKLALSTAGIISGVAQTGTLTATAASTDLTGYADDELIGRTIVFTGGTAAGQASEITDYANTSGVVTFNTISTAPANNDPFIIV